VDGSAGRILAIGGNVRGTVSLKLFPAIERAGEWRAVATGSRPLFAHLRLRSPSGLADDAFDRSPTLRQVGCLGPPPVEAWRAAADLLAPDARRCVS
jgi:hypothetical protein